MLNFVSKLKYHNNKAEWQSIHRTSTYEMQLQYYDLRNKYVDY